MHNQRTHSDEQDATFIVSTCSSMSPMLSKPRLAATAAGPLDRTSNTVNGWTSVNVIPTPAVAMVAQWPSVHAISSSALLSLSDQRLPGVVCSVSQSSRLKSLKFHCSSSAQVSRQCRRGSRLGSGPGPVRKLGKMCIFKFCKSVVRAPANGPVTVGATNLKGEAASSISSISQSSLRAASR